MHSDSPALGYADSPPTAVDPLSIPELSYASDEVGPVAQLVIRTIERLTGQRLLRRLYEQYRLQQRPPELFWQDAIAALRLDVRPNREPQRILPARGALAVISNHPFGIVDGMILCWFVAQVRPDYKIMTHNILYRATEVRPHVLPLDFSDTREAQHTNLRSRAEAQRLLQQGGVLIVFPAGAVAKSKTLRGPAEDLAWGSLAAKLILRSGADVLPVFFHGQNSRIFQLAANTHLTLKYALLLHEVRNKVGTRIDVCLGNVIAKERLRAVGDPKALTAFLRQAVADARLARD
jgi:putative hemolysin